MLYMEDESVVDGKIQYFAKKSQVWLIEILYCHVNLFPHKEKTSFHKKDALLLHFFSLSTFLYVVFFRIANSVEVSS